MRRWCMARRRRGARAVQPATPGAPPVPPLASWAAVAGAVLAGRLLANGWFAGAHGRYASINPETWFYAGYEDARVRGLDTALLSRWDPTAWVSQLTAGLSLESRYIAFVVLGCVTMAVTSGAVAAIAWRLATSAGVATDRWSAGCGAWAAGLCYWVLPWPYGASLSGFTHDTLGMLLAVAALLAGVVVDTGGGRRPGVWLALAGALGLGLAVGPTILGVGAVLALLALGWAARQAGAPGSWVAWVAVVATAAAAAAALTPQTGWAGWLWERVVDGAARGRGLDIALQRTTGAADLQPGHWRPLVSAYPVLAWGAGVAGALACAWRRRWVVWCFLCIAIVAFAVAARGARLIDPALAVGAGVSAAWLARRCPWRWAIVLVVGLATVAGAIRAHRGATRIIAVHDAHVELLRGLSGDDQAPGAILPASWDAGYMVAAVSGRPAAAHPGRINMDDAGEHDARIFWSPEEAAALEAARRNIRYLYVSNRDFAVLSEDPVADRFRSKRRLGFHVPLVTAAGARGPLPLSIARQLLIYRLLHEPTRLKHWRLADTAEILDTGEVVRIFERTGDPDPERSYFYALLHNKTSGAQSSSVQLRLVKPDAQVLHQGARLTTRLAAHQSGLATMGFPGRSAGRLEAQLENPAIEVRLLARVEDQRYKVEFVRPQAGWRPHDR